MLTRVAAIVQNSHWNFSHIQVPLANGGHMNMLFLTNADAADFEFSGL